MTSFVTGRGRPLRFVALVAAAWLSIRIASLWIQTGSLPEAIRELAPPDLPLLPIQAAPVVAATSPPGGRNGDGRSASPRTSERPAPSILSAPRREGRATKLMVAWVPHDPWASSPFLFDALPTDPSGHRGTFGATSPLATAGTAADVDAVQTGFPPSPSRWSASTWLTARPGGEPGVAPGGQLGGGQAGLRIAWIADPGRRVAIFGRFVTPLRGVGREATIGVEWQPVPLPLRLVIEHRTAVDGGRGGPGLGLVGGTDSRLPGGFRLETYAQAGAIRRERIEPYADGAARATRPVFTVGSARAAIGAGLWGAAQRGAERLDIGPSMTLAFPLAGQPVRIALDWRQRIAGDAQPGSGPALTIGSDF